MKKKGNKKTSRTKDRNIDEFMSPSMLAYLKKKEREVAKIRASLK